jgi:heat shock protein HslJ
MQKRIILIAIALSVALLVAACAPSNPLEGTDWVLVELGGAPPLASTNVTLSLFDDQVGGRDGCNHYSAPVTVRDGRFEVSPAIIGTLMACEEPIMEQADVYRQALTMATGYRLEGGRLTLLGSVGEALAVFEPLGE